jgi:hypothetical protein
VPGRRTSSWVGDDQRIPGVVCFWPLSLFLASITINILTEFGQRFKRAAYPWVFEDTISMYSMLLLLESNRSLVNVYGPCLHRCKLESGDLIFPVKSGNRNQADHSRYVSHARLNLNAWLRYCLLISAVSHKLGFIPLRSKHGQATEVSTVPKTPYPSCTARRQLDANGSLGWNVTCECSPVPLVTPRLLYQRKKCVCETELP